LKALLARKKQFEGPKSCLKYLEGAAGPKKQFEGPKTPSNERAFLTQRAQFEAFNKRQDRRKNLACVLIAQKGGTQKPRKKLSRKII
jgi:hypothetical protein